VLLSLSFFQKKSGGRAFGLETSQQHNLFFRTEMDLYCMNSPNPFDVQHPGN
jgi:hypothetical protein